MAYGDIRDDWKLRDIESTNERAIRSSENASAEASRARNDVISLEHTLSARIADLQCTIESMKSRMDGLEEDMHK